MSSIPSTRTATTAFIPWTRTSWPGSPVDDVEVLTNEAVLSPRERPGSEILGLLRNPLFGLPDAGKFTSEAYRPKIGLDYVAPPSIGVGVSRYGSYAGGGVAFLFSDMLGFHTLMAQAQVNNRIVDSAFQVAYLNTVNRLNFGAVVQRYPYMYGGYNYDYGVVDGQLALIEEEIVYRQINYDIGGFASYPFNSFQRVEVNGGFSYIDFSNTLYRYAYSDYDGYLLSREEYDLDSATRDLYALRRRGPGLRQLPVRGHGPDRRPELPL